MEKVVLSPTPAFDLTQKDSIKRPWAIKRPKPSFIWRASPLFPKRFVIRGNISTNMIGTLNLLQSLKDIGFSGNFLYVSSGDVYGRVPRLNSLSRNPGCQPAKPYSVSKLAARNTLSTMELCRAWRITVARPFNHIGPGQNESFIVPSVARQLQRIRKGLQAPPHSGGDVDITRDFIDVQDVVNAYLQLLENGQNGETYNVLGSGTVRS